MIVKTKIKSLIEEPITGEWGEEGNGVKVIRTTNFTNEGRLDLSEIVERNIPEQKVIRKKLRLGDIILEKSGGSPNQPVGRVVYFDVNGGETYLCNNFTTVIRAKKEVHSRFLFWFLFNQHLTKNTLRFQNKTTGILNLQLDRYLESLQIPNLAFETQQKIASILDKADELRRKDQQLLTKYDELLQSIFYQMFGDPVRNEKGWDNKPLESFAVKEKNAIVDGPFGASVKESDYVDESGIPVIRINNIRDDGFFSGDFRYLSEIKYSELIRSKVEPNDILIARVGHTIGKSCIFDQHFKALLSTTGICKATINSKVGNLYFLITQLNLPNYRCYIRNQIQGAGQPYLNLTMIKNFKLINPNIELQNSFGEKYFKIIEQRRKVKESLQKSELLFQSLLQKAFKGELIK